MIHQRLLAAMICAAIPVAHAETGDLLDEIVVTAARIEQPVSLTLTHTTVITARDIDNAGVADLPNLLRAQAGVEITQQGGIGKVSALHLRGTESTQSLVLLDGVRIGSATTGATAIDQLMLDQIDHIEIVRGNVSSLYGSEAIGGVIQIFTKRGKGKPSFHARAGTGSQNAQRMAAGFGGEVDATSFNLELSRFKNAGISAIDPNIVPTVNPDRNGYDNLSFSGNLNQAITPGHSISASVFGSRGDVSYDNAFGQATDVNTSRTNLEKYSLASDNRLADNWQSHLQWSEGRDEGRDYLNSAQSSLFRTVNRQVTWQNTFALSDHNDLLLGLENLNQRVSSSTLYSQVSRNVNSWFGGYEGNFGSHLVQANLRQDRYPGFGTANTGLLGYGYSFAESWRATANYSTAFRAPTFNDLYWPNEYGYQGNPDLRPERSHSIEVGLHFSRATERIDVVYFENRVRDLIDAGITTPINLNLASIDGIELGYAGKFAGFGVKASLTMQDPRNTHTGQALTRRAKTFSDLEVMRRLGEWQVAGEWRYNAVREDNYFDPVTYVSTRKTLPAFSLFNLSARYSISKGVDLSLRVDNLANQNDSSIYGYGYPGRSAFAGISYRE